MGAYNSKRIGSNPYYAGYERSFERLKTETDRLKVSLHRRKTRENQVGNTIFFYGAAGFAVAVMGAAWVVRQPAGTYTPQQHSLRVAPLFLEPLLAYVLYFVVLGAMHIFDRRDRRRLNGLNRRLRKMILELKDSTRYDKTQKLLEKYDPDYEVPTPRKLPPAPLPRQVTPGPMTPLPHQASAAAGGARRLSGLAHLSDAAGLSLMPAFDRLATTLIGDNPALTEALRAARGEAEQLKERVAHAEARIQELERANGQLRAQLGLAPEPGQAATLALAWKEDEEAQPAAVPDSDGVGQTENAQVIGSGGVVIEELEAKPSETEAKPSETGPPHASAQPGHEKIAENDSSGLRHGLADID